MEARARARTIVGRKDEGRRRHGRGRRARGSRGPERRRRLRRRLRKRQQRARLAELLLARCRRPRRRLALARRGGRRGRRGRPARRGSDALTALLRRRRLCELECENIPAERRRRGRRAARVRRRLGVYRAEAGRALGAAREGGREGKEAVWEGRREVEGTRVSVREIEGRGCATDGRGSTTCSPTSRADAGSTCSTCSTAACGTSSACTDGVCACASRRRPLVDVLQCPSTLPTRRSHRPSCCGLRPPPRAASLAARATSTGPCDRYVRRRRVDMPSTGQIVGARGQEGGSTPTREVELRERGRRGGGRSGGARYVCWTKWAMRTAPRGVSAEAELEGGRVGGRREGHAGDERAAWLVAHVARAAEVVQYEVREQICTDQGRRVSSERAGRARSDELGGGRGGRESDAPWADSSMPWVELKTSIVTAPCLARAVARRGVVSGSSPYQSLLSSSRPSRRRSRPGRCW